MINTLQVYYGMAIRQNCNDLRQMQSAVYATLYHVSSTDEEPRHEHCPSGPDSWCGWQNEPDTYKHKYGLPQAIIDVIEPIFAELSTHELLSKCLHEQTQNPNEAFHHLIWDRCPKE